MLGQVYLMGFGAKSVGMYVFNVINDVVLRDNKVWSWDVGRSVRTDTTDIPLFSFDGSLEGANGDGVLLYGMLGEMMTKELLAVCSLLAVSREFNTNGLGLGSNLSFCLGDFATGFGSVQVKREFTKDFFGSFRKVKVYPLLTHVLKTLTDVNLGFMPGTPSQLRSKLTALRELLRKLEARQEKLGGYRIEVTFCGEWDRMKEVASVICSPEGLIRYFGEIVWLVFFF